MYTQGIIVFLMIGMATSYSLVRAGPYTTCSGEVVKNAYGTISQECPMPSFITIRSTPHVETEVTEAATINDVKVSWFLNEGDPALNVTFKASSPNSAQEYSINVMADGSLYPVYCGSISTEAPALESCPQEQTISVEIKCLSNLLKPYKNGMVAVNLKNSPQNVVYSYQLPDCTDKTMAQTSYCIAEEKKKIAFSLHQFGNSTKVFLNTQSAYSTTDSVYLAIAKRNESAFRSWQSIGREKTLEFPQRTVTFSDLEIGSTYQVTVWRPSEPGTRYQEIITLKPDLKQKSTVFMKRLLRSALHKY